MHIAALLVKYYSTVHSVELLCSSMPQVMACRLLSVAHAVLAVVICLRGFEYLLRMVLYWQNAHTCFLEAGTPV